MKLSYSIKSIYELPKEIPSHNTHLNQLNETREAEKIALQHELRNLLVIIPEITVHTIQQYRSDNMVVTFEEIAHVIIFSPKGVMVE
jgi:hypothetical protein